MTPGGRSTPAAGHPPSVAGRLAGMVALALMVALPVLGGAPQKPARDAAAVAAPGARPHRVIAYYFHTTVRCASCRAIETYSREAIESAFAGQLGDSSLVWKVVNIDVKGNEHYVKDYALYTKSLILVHEQPGRPERWKNLVRVWQLLRDKPAFQRYVQDETRAFLAEPS